MRWFAIAGLVAGLAACSDSPAPPGAAPAPGGAATRSASSAGGSERPTLISLLGLGGSTADYGRQISATEQDRQQLIRDCMAKQGFRYVPHVVAGRQANPTGLPTDLPADEFQRRYGYGISTGFENALKLKPKAADVDPNVAVVAAMSESERAAYQRALGGGTAANGKPAGCQGEASKVTDKAGAVVEQFGDELGQLYARVNADRRIVTAERAWADCLAKAGYPYADEDAVRKEITRRMNPLYDSLSGEDVPDGVIDLYRDRRLTGAQQSLLASVKSFELAVATADQKCGGDLDRIRKEVRDEYEAGFVDQHRGELRKIIPNAGL
ncbi:hypothetical protein DMB66_10545 [Actinoplanes sp. ATCC 53533]|nr:hypothetical protein DMB66_10545 [Actinoplanes sp. ATCC 53533]